MTIEPTNVSEGLEPCPFCGEPAALQDAYLAQIMREEPSAYCWQCGFSLPVEKWNTRATLSPPLPSRPIAWRWRYVYPDRVGHWTVRQTPIEPLAARAGYAALEVEPLYASLPSPGVERLREALQVIADRPGAGMGYAKCGGEFPIDEAANMANIARAALSALPLDGGLK